MSINIGSPGQVIGGIDVLFVDTREIKEHKNCHHNDDDRRHNQHHDAQEETLSSELIYLRQVDVLFAIKIRDIKSIIDLYPVGDIFVESVPYVTPKLIEGRKTFHLVPYNHMLIGRI